MSRHPYPRDYELAIVQAAELVDKEMLAHAVEGRREGAARELLEVFGLRKVGYGAIGFVWIDHDAPCQIRVQKILDPMS